MLDKILLQNALATPPTYFPSILNLAILFAELSVLVAVLYICYRVLVGVI